MQNKNMIIKLHCKMKVNQQLSLQLINVSAQINK